jgi:hypothetical protein
MSIVKTTVVHINNTGAFDIPSNMLAECCIEYHPACIVAFG